MKRPPEPGAKVGVNVHEWGARLSAIVEEVDAEVVAIRVSSARGWESKLAEGVEVELEWATARGLMRFRGVTAAGRPESGRGVLVSIAGEPELVQRRGYTRAKSAVDVRVRRIGRSRDVIEGLTLDVSGGGCQASLPGLPVEVDDRLALELALPEEAPVEAEARVVRSVADEISGLTFEAIDEQARERLIGFVFDKLLHPGGKDSLSRFDPSQRALPDA